MKQILFVVLSFLICYIIEKITHVKPTIDFADKFEYVPILTANIYVDLFIIFITFSQFYKMTSLERWYKKYRLSAMIADILIIVLGILLGRYLVYILKLRVGLTMFALLCVIIQTIHDLLFYLLFRFIPYGRNDMLDFFKGYAKKVGINALLGDSVLVILAVILSALLNARSFDTNIVLLILGVYLAPYFIYMKD